MTPKILHKIGAFVLVIGFAWGCKSPAPLPDMQPKGTPSAFGSSTDSSNSAQLSWRTYFTDPKLLAYIDTALANNQELSMTYQEMLIRENEIGTRKGEYLPFVSLGAASGIEKDGSKTRHGVVDEHFQSSLPDPLSDYLIGANASWEVDIWKKLRNAKKSAVYRYLASVEGKNFIVTQLVAEVASTYYELIALDNMLQIVERNLTIQSDALQVVKQQKLAAKVTQLAVNRFEAQLLNTKNLQFEIKQRRTEAENKLNFLLGRYPKPIARSSDSFLALTTDNISVGLPSQLLRNRPDVREKELELAAAKLDVLSARANFYPSLRISAGVGFRSFDAAYLLHPESVMYNLAGDLMAPLVNRYAIRAAYQTASAKQLQAIFSYQQTVLTAYTEVMNQMAKLDNYSSSFETKSKEVELLNESVGIANNLFYSARADYMEVLLTQREALDSRMELVEIKLDQLLAQVSIYRSLGGGWR